MHATLWDEVWVTAVFVSLFVAGRVAIVWSRRR